MQCNAYVPHTRYIHTRYIRDTPPNLSFIDISVSSQPFPSTQTTTYKNLAINGRSYKAVHALYSINLCTIGGPPIPSYRPPIPSYPLLSPHIPSYLLLSPPIPSYPLLQPDTSFVHLHTSILPLLCPFLTTRRGLLTFGGPLHIIERIEVLHDVYRRSRRRKRSTVVGTAISAATVCLCLRGTGQVYSLEGSRHFL